MIGRSFIAAPQAGERGRMLRLRGSFRLMSTLPPPAGPPPAAAIMCNAKKHGFPALGNYVIQCRLLSGRGLPEDRRDAIH